MSEVSAKWERHRFNPIDRMRQLFPGADLSHITFNPNLERQFRRLHEGGCDGTLSLIYDDMRTWLWPLVSMQSWWMKDPPRPGALRIEYEVGMASMATVYGKIMLRVGGPYPGMLYRFRCPVRATVIYP